MKYITALKKKQEFLDIITDQSGWTTTILNKKEGIHCEQKLSKRKFPLIRVKSHSNYDALTTFYALGHPEFRIKYDKNFSLIKPIENVGVNLIVAYIQTRKMFAISQRDAYMNFFWDIDEQGRIFMVTFDNMNGEEYPEEEGFVRLQAPIGGFLYTPDKKDPNKCSIEMVVEVEMGGYIPQKVTNLLMQNSANAHVLLR
jgi:hypothetical protein